MNTPKWSIGNREVNIKDTDKKTAISYRMLPLYYGMHEVGLIHAEHKDTAQRIADAMNEQEVSA